MMRCDSELQFFELLNIFCQFFQLICRDLHLSAQAVDIIKELLDPALHDHDEKKKKYNNQTENDHDQFDHLFSSEQRTCEPVDESLS